MENKHPDPRDANAVAGSAVGSRTAEEQRSSATVVVPLNNKSLKNVGNQVVSAAKWHVSSMVDSVNATKYAGNPGVNYIAGGALSILAKAGQLLFSDTSNQPGKGALNVDQKNSFFQSSGAETKVGTLDISTIDGKRVNPQSDKSPSSSFGPVKAWLKSLFPSFPTKTLVQIAVLELLQAALKELDQNKEETKEEITRKDDIGLIIVDNQEIEDRILNNKKPV